MNSSSPLRGSTADVVVVGGGTVGAWCAYFLKRSGAGRVVLLEQATLGHGASSRAAGIVRSQGGTPTAITLAEWSRRFYLAQHEELGVDSGFVRQSYFLPAFDADELEAARARQEMQRALGLDVELVGQAEAEALNPTMAKGSCLGGTYFAEDGYVDPPRNVLAYAVALAMSGVDVRERTAFTGLVLDSHGVAGVETSGGTVSTRTVVLTGGPELAAVGRTAGLAIPVGGARHQVAVTAPHPGLDPRRLPMVFDVVAGLYWRPEEGGLLFGMSNPDEAPGPARELDWPYLDSMRRRLARLVPVTNGLGLRRAWSATIDYTSDHLPIIGPGAGSGGELVGSFVASAGGHGMMWGPGVARAAADVVLHGTSRVLDVTRLGLDRFDADGNSALDPDPIALPFPEKALTI